MVKAVLVASPGFVKVCPLPLLSTGAILRCPCLTISHLAVNSPRWALQDKFLEYMRAKAVQTDNKVLITHKSKFVPVHSSTGYLHSLKGRDGLSPQFCVWHRCLYGVSRLYLTMFSTLVRQRSLPIQW